jgi:phospholipid/cholesterol/gamma-HCH transport system substrate-binding protein
VEVEELLGALSLVLNGGGLQQLQTINHELGIALEGREEGIKNTLTQLDTFIGGLDEQRTEIQRALDSVNALAETLASRTATIETALDTIGPGLDVINEQRDLLVDMLDGLARLGDVGTRIINASAANTIEDLRLLQPILTQLAAAGPDLARSLPLLLTYPFPDSSLSALNYRDAQTGGYALFTNMTATIDLDLTNLLCRYAIDPVTGGIEELEPQDLAGGACGVPGSPPGNQTGAEQSSDGPLGLPTLPGDVVGDVVEGATGGDPGLPGLPQLPGGQG